MHADRLNAMRDRLVFTPTDVFRHMIDDLRILATLPMEELREISQQLTDAKGFLRDDQLELILEEHLHDEGIRSAIFNALQNLRPNAIEQILEAVEAWRDVNVADGDSFSDKLLDDLRTRLRALIQPYPALDRMRKAQHLRSAIGSELKSAVFICDSRPVYNESRDQIEGLIPLITLRLIFERQNQSTEEIEVVLSSEQLERLVDQAQNAQKKLEVLRGYINDWLPHGCVDCQD